jgi:AcrR family transcriptional regulator
VTAILQAGEEIIAAEGFGRASTNRIAARAGVSIGSLYQYFPNKEAIRQQLVAQHRQRADQIIERALTRIEDPTIPFANALRALFEELVAMHQENPALIRALFEGLPNPEWQAEQREQEMRPYVQRMEALLRSRAEPAFNKPEEAAWIIVWAIEALSRLLAHEAPGDVSVPLLIEEAVAMVAGYARVTP